MRAPINQYLPDGQPCSQCNRTDADYSAQTADGSTICQLCLEEELDGLEVELGPVEFTDDAKGPGRRYAAKASVWRESRTRAFQDYGFGSTQLEAIDQAKQRALRSAFPPGCEHRPGNKDKTQKVVTHLRSLPSAPSTPPPSFPVELTGVHQVPTDQPTRNSELGTRNSIPTDQPPTMEIDRPGNGAAPPVPPPGQPIQEKRRSKDPRKHWHATVAELPLLMTAEQERILLGVESRADADLEWMDQLAYELKTWSAVEIALLLDLTSAASMDELRRAWDCLPTHMCQYLRVAKDFLKARLTEPVQQAPEPDYQALKHHICKGCHADVLWGTTAKGKSTPLNYPERRAVEPAPGSDEKPQKRYVIRGVNKLQLIDTWDYRPDAASCVAYMSHHATCPEVGQFRRGGAA